MTESSLSGKAVRQAFMYGEVGLIEACSEVPWDEALEEGPWHRLIATSIYGISDGIEDALLCLMQKASNDGRREIFEINDSTLNGQQFPAPILALIEKGFDRALLCFIQNGFDPLKPYGESQRNALDWAQGMKKESAMDVIRSYSARRVANGILLDIDADIDAKATPKLAP